MRRSLYLLLIVLFLTAVVTLPAIAGDKPARSKGQTLYVPAYSHVVHGDRNQPFHLTATLSVRNADPSHPITVSSVEYRDSKGAMIRQLITEPPKPMAPFSSAEFVVGESDKTGGQGASFVVRWNAETAVVAPVVETVLIGTAASQGISFVGGARIIEDLGN